MIKAASLNIEINLLPLSQLLRQKGIVHQINEESGKQVIWVESQAQADYVQTALEHYRAGGFNDDTGEHFNPLATNADRQEWQLQVKQYGKQFINLFLQSPVTMTLTVACVLVALISSLGANTSGVRFLFYPLIATDGIGALLASITSVEVFLRTFGPMLLHFSVLHIVFNLLWLWYFGRQLETIYSSWLFLLVVLFTSFVANTTQYLASGYNNFGGMSGVVYGLVAYTWVLHSLVPRSRLMLNNSMFMFFVAALVIMEVVASSWIATAAHLGGLFSGLVIGVAVVGYLRLKGESR